MLTTKKKQSVIKKNQVHDKDTGSTKVQIAILSTQIEELAKHLKKHAKDIHSRRGLIKMVSERRSHMKYLERTDKTLFTKIQKEIKGN